MDKDTNVEIKSLLINVMKDQHSVMSVKERSMLYSKELYSEIAQENNSHRARSLIVIANHSFMDSVIKTDANEYSAVIQLIWPDDWKYHFTIYQKDNHFYVSNILIDP